jgi:hypothetical protein
MRSSPGVYVCASMYVVIFMCVCVYVCVHVYIYIYIYIREKSSCVYVCMHVSINVYTSDVKRQTIYVRICSNSGFAYVYLFCLLDMCVRESEREVHTHLHKRIHAYITTHAHT